MIIIRVYYKGLNKRILAELYLDNIYVVKVGNNNESITNVKNMSIFRNFYEMKFKITNRYSKGHPGELTIGTRVTSALRG